MPVLLYGPPGTGKTSLIEAAFSDLITVAGDGDTTVGDLIGEYTQDAGSGYEFVYGPLVTAMQEGRALLHATAHRPTTAFTWTRQSTSGQARTDHHRFPRGAS